jgi:hypothetical protein
VYLYHRTMMGMRLSRRYQRKSSGARSNVSSSTGTWIWCFSGCVIHRALSHTTNDAFGHYRLFTRDKLAR